MTVLPVLIAPHPILKEIAKPVEGAVDKDLQHLMDNMAETMYADQGIGLAAPQVGVSKRILVLDIDQKDGVRGKAQFFINPEITWASEETNIYNEGCLSVPDQYADVERPKKIRVKFIGYDGKAQEIEADGLLATCLQHEMDHLNGILFVDHLSSLKRDMLLRKLKKLVKIEGLEDRTKALL